ncbi:MAG TPA: hypothetical protein VIM55_13645 [Mucilaginibacter sp.]
MDDQLDKDLQNRIREVFDNYEDTSADEGWLLLREKFPAERKKRRAIAWLWWGAAAVLLAFLGLGLWLRQEQDKPVKQFTHVKPLHLHQQMPVQKAQKDSAENVAATPVVRPAVKPAQPGAMRTEAQNRNYQARIVKQKDTIAGPVNRVQPKAAATVAVPGNLSQQVIAQQSPVSKQSAAGNAVPVAQTPLTAPTAATNPVTAPATTITTTAPVIAQQQQDKPKRTITDMFNEDKGGQPVKKEEITAGKKVHFGVYAGTYFNYSKGSDNEVNLGGGVSSDIRISRNLKLVTGIAIAQNSMSYHGIPTPAASARSNLVTPAAYGAQEAKFEAISGPTVKSYNASLIGLDIPVNLKYEFNPQKTDAYVSVGLSSGTFIDESYTYKYNYPSFLSSSLQQTRDQSTGDNFSGFYFAKTLNVAFGIGYPFGKNRLVIEPFVKYPLDGMGTQNLKFGAGGVNLKFNFLTPHK